MTATSKATTSTTVTTMIETLITTTENNKHEQILEAIEYVCNDRWGGYINEPYDVFNGTEHIIYDNEIDFYIDNVSKVKNDVLGEIANEQDLIAKSREIFIDILGQDFIDDVEADYYVKDGEKLAIIERTTPVYDVTYYEEYDVWHIVPYIPNGTLENGQKLIRICEWPPFLMVCGNDGKIIRCCF